MSSAALSLIAAVEANGGRITVEGQWLVIDPREAGLPIADELRQHKAEIMAELAQRLTMPAGVRLIHWQPKAPPIRLSECSTVTDTEKFVRTTLRQLDAHLRGEYWRAGNWGLSTLLARLEMCGCTVELEDPGKALQ
jgi:hypothetical protein